MEEQHAEGKLILRLEVPNYLIRLKGGKQKSMSCVPSLNELFGMQHWARAKRKTDIQHAILSALREYRDASLMRTTCAENTGAIFYDTAARYLTTHQNKPQSTTRKGRFGVVRKSTQS